MILCDCIVTPPFKETSPENFNRQTAKIRVGTGASIKIKLSKFFFILFLKEGAKRS
jgi:hypothetical protein